MIGQSTSCDVDPLSITTCCNRQSSSHVNPMIIDEQRTATPVDDDIKVKVSIHIVFTLVCIPNLSTELCTVAICKDLLSYCNSCICTWNSVVHLGTVAM